MKSVTNPKKSLYFVFLLDPRWASVNRGVLICDECCSVHRSLGRHSSQVRHLRHTPWPPTQLQVHTLYHKAWYVSMPGLFFKTVPPEILNGSILFHYLTSRWFRRYTATEPIQYGSTPFWTQPQWWAENGRPTLRTSCSEWPLFSSDGGVICLDVTEWFHLFFMFLVTKAQTNQSL